MGLLIDSFVFLVSHNLFKAPLLMFCFMEDMAPLLQCVCVCLCSGRVLELSDTVKHLRSQGAVKDASLDTMQNSLDRMVRPPGSPL